jgi:lipoprotein-anchoring transpeptidase ErfK/SrfK
VARWTVVAIVSMVAVAAAVVLLANRGPDGSQQPRSPRAPARVPPGPHGARLLRPVLLRERPGGRGVRMLGTRTGYGSPRVLAVVTRRGKWLGVLSQYRPNSRVGWIPASEALLLHRRYRLDVDLSSRVLVVRRDGRFRRRIVVAVGRPGSVTPTGRFAVTDLLKIGRRGGPYGCCALALTGRQPNVPQGWTGGDRLAIHGTSSNGSVGSAVSGGCLRASDRDMRWLLARVPLGAVVRVRA